MKGDRVMTRIGHNLEKTIAKASMKMGVSSLDSACFFLFNQPEIPEGMKKYKK